MSDLSFKHIRVFLVFLTALCAIMIFQPAAQAQIVDLKFVNVGPGSFFPVTFPGAVSSNTGVGVYNLYIDGWGPVSGFCIENQAALSSFNQYELLEITDEPKTKAAWIADQYFNQAAGWSPQAAQLAIWEVVLENAVGPLSLSTGNLFTANSFAGDADDILTALNAADLSAFDPSGFMWARSPIGQQDPAVPQDYLIPRVPEPGTLLMIGFGLIGIAAISRKKFLK